MGLRKTVSIPALTDSQHANFWAKVDPTGFCWEWTAHKNKERYGQFNIGRTGRKFGAHRIAYTLLVGPIPAGLELDHLCRNRGCVNPDHLDPVTSAVNTSRIPEPIIRARNENAARFGFSAHTTGKNISGFCIAGHEYTETNTYTYSDGRTECRICKRENGRKYREQARAKRSLVMAL